MTVAKAIEKDVPLRLLAIGTVQASQTVTLRSQVEGQLAEVHFQEGQTVSEGDLLFTLDPRPFATAVRQAEANLAKAIAEADNADVEAARLRSLLKRAAVSKEESEQADTSAAMARATVKADEAAVETAKLQLDYSRIRAPINGRIGRLLAYPGDTVRARNTVLAVLHRTRPIDVIFSVPEQKLPEIRRSSAEREIPASALATDHTGPAVTGKVTFIDNAIDTTTGTVTLKASFANEEEVLWPGQFVDVELTLSTYPNAIVVPSQTVQTGQEGAYVFVVAADSSVEMRPVRTGYSFGAETIVLDGVRAGETLVADGQLRLAPGMKVDIKGADSAAPDSARAAKP